MAHSKLMELLTTSDEIIFKIDVVTNPFYCTTLLRSVPLDDCLNGVALQNLKTRIGDLLGDHYDYDNATIFYHGYKPFNKVQLFDDSDVINVLKTNSFRMLHSWVPCLKISVKLSKKQKPKTWDSFWANLFSCWQFECAPSVEKVEEPGIDDGHVTEPAPEEQLELLKRPESSSDWSLAEEVELGRNGEVIETVAIIECSADPDDSTKDESCTMKTEESDTVNPQESSANAELCEKSDEQNDQHESTGIPVDDARTTLKSDVKTIPIVEERFNDIDISKAMSFLGKMGFTDEGGWLSRLVEVKRGDVTEILRVLSADYSFPEDEDD